MILDIKLQKKKIRELLKSIAIKFYSDFVGMALYDPINFEFRWRIAIGSLNDRYKGIVVRRGKGVCGNVLKTKREYIIHSFPFDIEDDPLNYPIMVVEDLKSAMAIPLFFEMESMGVLLVGHRSERIYQIDEVEELKKDSSEIIQIYNEMMKTQDFKTNQEKDSYLLAYLLNEKYEKKRRLKIEVLDQRIANISMDAQITIIQVFEILFGMVHFSSRDNPLLIIFERKNDQQLSIHVVIEYQLQMTGPQFSLLAEKVGNVNGNLEIYSELNKVHLIINLPIGLLNIEHPWNL
ncbi:GAF domain-containing protein [Calidifontibacillus erzurumensis]|uniref:GAF domain-containing protein n=2 Tax=Calidifontibacillus erzurumensis TaxID=2741433 RepID=A0A8J8KD44_9BACI|nr:GAF domain-containing protein [Calidifontibacillus erzurumensis]NSL52643.1 GAF domain-containing protein [Calidifontibacillus erzurumensis]